MKKTNKYGKPFDPKRGKRRSPPGGSHAGRGKSWDKPKGELTVWDQAARWYDSLVGEEGSYYQRAIVIPRTLQLLNLQKGDRVLDLACGQGVFSRFLRSKGIKVEGLDSSEELIRYAQSRSDKEIPFHVADSRNAGILEGEKFDAVVCILAIQNIDALEPVFRNVARWLKPKGRFVMVMTHPCFRVPRQTHWGWDEQKKLEYRRVDLYATETPIPILTPPMAKSEVYTMTYHRPLQSYFKALAEAGLVVDGLEEWASNKVSQPGKRSRAENRARNEIPLFMALRAVLPA